MDAGGGVAVDSANNIYVTGYTYSLNFPTTIGAYSQTLTGLGSVDAFVTKIAANGASLTYSTYVGGTGFETGESIALDSSGKAYITGVTSATDLVTVAPYSNTNSGGTDGYITVLSPDGRTSTFSTYLGGSRDDQGYGIAVDSLFNIYIAGITVSTNFPTRNAYDPSFNDGGGTDAFVTKFSLAPTAAAASVTGRVLTTAKRAVRNALVNLQGSNGSTRTIKTNWQGEFAFENVPTGDSYIVSVTAKNYMMTPNYQTFNLVEEPAILEFIALPY